MLKFLNLLSNLHIKVQEKWMSYHANIVEIIWQNLAFLKVIIDTTFLDNSGKLIQKLAIFWQKSTLATTFNRENFTSMHK